jgi:protein N-terminal glutamine amidohydrolase
MLDIVIFNSSTRSESDSTIGSMLKLNSARRTALSSASEQELRVPYYCEENVWRLAYRLLHGNTKGYSPVDRENTSYWVVFISNERKCCPMLQQLASEDPETKPCLWDYHVILLETTKVIRRGKTVEETKVLDVDSTLPFPVSLQDYVNSTFIKFSNEEANRKYSPLFRVVRADTFLMHFYSDRSHMKKEDGTWIAPPPSYDCIMTADAKLNPKGQTSNLDGYTRMTGTKRDSDRSNIFGELLTIEQMQERFRFFKMTERMPGCLSVQPCF